MPKLRVGVIYGGRSGEHEVSLLSAQSVINALDQTKYTIVPIKIDPAGNWEGISIQSDPKGNPDLDVVFPVLHGPYGEDGTIQGLLELANLPYVGAGVTSSAVAMDKALMRILFSGAGLPLLPWESVLHYQWQGDAIGIKDRLETSLGYPMFVKPANLGSSVGISKVKSPADLGPALDEAFAFDRKVVVEQGLIGAREVECSVLGHNHPQASVAGEIVPAHEFYDYGAKYHNEQSRLIIPAPLDAKQAACIADYAIRAFRAVDCSGMGRVDFFVDQQGEIFVNEINTIPGFTQISMYPKLWEHSGLPYTNLLDRLIAIALEKHQERQALRTTIS
ncbi:MAG: D-alanine--D-alanine ligase [Limnochordia bacterium]|nr:D-alanine--D-alanine ligase [Limnochordia bacterium]